MRRDRAGDPVLQHGTCGAQHRQRRLACGYDADGFALGNEMGRAAGQGRGHQRVGIGRVDGSPKNGERVEPKTFERAGQ